MHGLILLTALAALGVDWDWRELEDKQIEYMLLVEPKNLQLLSQGGDPLRSSLPSDVARVDRLMIRIGTRFPGGGTRIPADTFLRADMRAAGDEYPQAVVFQNGQAAASPEVKFGWQAGLDPQQVDFLVQISPTLLATLRDGDELYVPVPAAAGKVTQFVISTGVQELPRVGAAQNRFGPEPNPRFASSQPTRITADPPNDFRSPPGGFSPPPSTLSPAPNNSFGPAPNPSFGPAPLGSSPAPLNPGPAAFAADPSTRRNSLGTGEAAQTQFAAQPTNNNFTASLPPGDRPAQQPPSSNNLFPSNNNPSTYTPNSGLGAPAARPTYPRGVEDERRRSTASR